MDCRALVVDLDIDHWRSKVPFPGSCHLIAQLGSIPQCQPSIESQFCMTDSFCWPCVISWSVGRDFSHTDGRTLLFFLSKFNRMISFISYMKMLPDSHATGSVQDTALNVYILWVTLTRTVCVVWMQYPMIPVLCALLYCLDYK